LLDNLTDAPLPEQATTPAPVERPGTSERPDQATPAPSGDPKALRDQPAPDVPRPDVSGTIVHSSPEGTEIASATVPSVGGAIVLPAGDTERGDSADVGAPGDRSLVPQALRDVIQEAVDIMGEDGYRDVPVIDETGDDGNHEASGRTAVSEGQDGGAAGTRGTDQRAWLKEVLAQIQVTPWQIKNMLCQDHCMCLGGPDLCK
jgi:hypothetical protein